MQPEVGDLPYCYLTTTGRRSGEPHTIEIWFGLDGWTLYLLAGNGERSDWVRNLKKQPGVQVRVNDVTYAATARVVSDEEEDRKARAMLVAKYQPTYDKDLTDWGRTALPVALDLVR